MARKEDSLPILLIKLPWWVSVMVAGVVYAGMRWGFPAYFNDSPFSSSMAHAVSNLAPMGGLIFLLIAGVSAIFGAKRRRLVESQTGLESLRALHWHDFEYIADGVGPLGARSSDSQHSQ